MTRHALATRVWLWWHTRHNQVVKYRASYGTPAYYSCGCGKVRLR